MSNDDFELIRGSRSVFRHSAMLDAWEAKSWRDTIFEAVEHVGSRMSPRFGCTGA